MSKQQQPKRKPEKNVDEQVDLPADSLPQIDQSSIIPVPLSPLQRMCRVNALTGVLSDKAFTELVLSLKEGPYLLDVFARAIESELEEMFQGKDPKIKEGLASLIQSIDVAYAKAQAIAASPLQDVLERLCVNLGGSLQPAPTQPHPSAYPASGLRRGEGVGGF